MKSAVVLLSGGLDSAVLLADLLSAGLSVKALSIHYGQRHQKELQAATNLAKFYEVEHEILEIPQLRKLLSGSALTSDDVSVPHGHYAEESMKQTVVPNRNMIFLALAGAMAVSQKLDGVAYAAHAGDHSIYPDCRPEFIASMAQSLGLCDWRSIELLTPFSGKNKSEIVKRGMELIVPFDKTWSCYEGGRFHCGKCGTCVERKEAFGIAEVQDPTNYLNEEGPK